MSASRRDIPRRQSKAKQIKWSIDEGADYTEHNLYKMYIIDVNC